jgi:hypothetical protein
VDIYRHPPGSYFDSILSIIIAVIGGSVKNTCKALSNSIFTLPLFGELFKLVGSGGFRRVQTFSVPLGCLLAQ